MTKYINIIFFACSFIQLFTYSSEVITEECRQAVSTETEQCKINKWNSTLLNMDKIKASCCHGWELIDCNEKVVKEKCTEENFEKVQKYYLNLINQESKRICRDYQYYSTMCTISNEDIKSDASDVEKRQLITDVPVPSDRCQVHIEKTADTCAEKVAVESGYNRGYLKNTTTKHKVECCLKYLTSDCFLETAKKTDKCSHQDVIGLISIHDEINKKMEKTNCHDYPYGSKQCENNNSCYLGTNAGLFFLVILLSSSYAIYNL